MKIPRLTSGPCCYTLRQWASRMAISDMSTGLIVAGVCFYMSSLIDIYAENTTGSTTVDPEVDKEAVKAWLIAVGVLFCIPIVFAILLLAALWNENKKLLLIWCGYAAVVTILYAIFFIILVIFAFVAGLIGPGFLILGFGVIIDAHSIYSFLIAYGIYLEIKENEATRARQTQQI